MRRTTTITAGFIAWIALLAIAGAVIDARPAEALSARGNLKTTISPSGVSQTASYTLGLFAASKKDPDIAGYTLQFPADTEVTTNTVSAGAGDITVVDPSTRTVQVTFGTPIDSQTERTFSLQLDNVISPSTAGTYQIAQVVFTFTDGTTTAVPLSANSAYAVTIFSVTISTPDPGQMVDFGIVDPGVTSPAKNVSIAVESSSPYTITRTLGPEAPLLGLAVTGTASGVSLPAGTATYADAYTITPPWTTPPEVPITTSVAYTVVQQ